MKKYLTYIIVGLILCVLSGVFIGGCHYGQTTVKCPKIDTTYVYKYDTVWKHIDHFIAGKDTIIYDTTFIEKPVDTAYILRDYFAKRVSSRTFPNDTIDIVVKDTITQNRLKSQSVSYKIKVPFTTINTIVDNSTTFNRYVYFGIDIPIKNVNYIELESTYNTEKYYFGVGYTPQLKSLNLKLGLQIMKFKRNDFR